MDQKMFILLTETTRPAKTIGRKFQKKYFGIFMQHGIVCIVLTTLSVPTVIQEVSATILFSVRLEKYNNAAKK
jgi:hypothetical protein